MVHKQPSLSGLGGLWTINPCLLWFIYYIIPNIAVLIVGWEQAFTEVNEGIGTFQLRVLFMNLSDEIVLSDGFVFSLDLETVPDTAGKMYCILYSPVIICVTHATLWESAVHKKSHKNPYQYYKSHVLRLNVQ